MCVCARAEDSENTRGDDKAKEKAYQLLPQPFQGLPKIPCCLCWYFHLSVLDRVLRNDLVTSLRDLWLVPAPFRLSAKSPRVNE